MNFYLSVIDDQLKTNDDNHSIGIILCKSKNKLEVEFALQGMNKPINWKNHPFSTPSPFQILFSTFGYDR